MRMHADGEAIFHSEEAFGAVKSEMGGIGCLVATGADYDHRQNSKIERHFRRLGDDARPGFLRRWPTTAVRPPPGRGRSGCRLRQVRAASPAASATERPTSRDRTPGPGPWSHKVDAAG